MPDAFPDSDAAEFINASRKILLTTGKSEAWAEFAGASNLIGWRYRALFNSWNAHKASWQQFGPAADHEEIYERDLQFFLMFGAGVSCLESTAYCLAALSSHDLVLGMSFDEPRRRHCGPKKLFEWLEPHERAAPLVHALKRLVSASEWETWIALRNRLTHRSNLPRVVVAALGGPLPPSKPLHYARTSTTPAVEGGFDEFERLVNWLTDSLKELLQHGTQLAAHPNNSYMDSSRK